MASYLQLMTLEQVQDYNGISMMVGGVLSSPVMDALIMSTGYVRSSTDRIYVRLRSRSGNAFSMLPVLPVLPVRKDR